MITLMAPLSLTYALGTATGQTLTGLHKLVRMAHAHAEDKMHYRHIHDPLFVTFADAACVNRRDLRSHCGRICTATEASLLRGQHHSIRSVGAAMFAHESLEARAVQKQSCYQEKIEYVKSLMHETHMRHREFASNWRASVRNTRSIAGCFDSHLRRCQVLRVGSAQRD